MLHFFCFLDVLLDGDGYSFLPQNLQKLRASMDQQCPHGEDEDEMDGESEHSQLLRLMARHTQLKDLLRAHHIIGTCTFFFCLLM